VSRPLLAVWLALAGCGTDVDIGGPADASVEANVDAEVPDDCDPCESAQDCAISAVCAQFSGDEFCAKKCPIGNECAADEVCTSVAVTTGGNTNACLPKSGTCAPAPPPPPTRDGAPLESCGVLNGPTIASECHACGKFSDDCQANGCYGGYWCNTSTRRCQRPPTSCP
jgi:hypothetical protein